MTLSARYINRHPERTRAAPKSIRAERESQPQAARRAVTGVAGNDPVTFQDGDLPKEIL
jgi:hypothetical protein